MPTHCIFWGEYLKTMSAALKNLTFQEKYAYLLKQFRDVFGENIFSIDSSKNIVALNNAFNIKDIQLYVIYMIKYVRPYVISQIDTAKGKNRQLFRRILAIKFYYWYLEKKKLGFLYKKNYTI